MKQERKVNPHNRGSIKECSISQMEYIEYRQTGMIKIKETPLSKGEHHHYNDDASYYDVVEGNQYKWFEDLDLF